MRVMVIVKSTPEIEANEVPEAEMTKMFEEMGKYNEELANAGIWSWKVDSLEQAIDWAKRCPNPSGAEGQLEVRVIGEMEDFSDAMTPELIEQEQRLRDQIEKNQQS